MDMVTRPWSRSLKTSLGTKNCSLGLLIGWTAKWFYFCA